MRSAALLFVLPVSMVLVAFACSSNPATPKSGGADAGASGHALGTPCDPSAPIPCETLTDACSVAVCDPSTLLCVRVAVDAGPVCTGGVPSCTDCDGGIEPSDAAADVSAEAGDAGDAAIANDASLPDADASLPDADASRGVSDAGDE